MLPRGVDCGVLAVIGTALALAGAASAEPRPESGWLDRSHLTGDWGGRRTLLAGHGIVPRARYTAGFWSNVRGGFQTGTRYEGFAEWALAVDFDSLLGWKGGSLDINWYSYHGGQPSEDLVGPFLTQTVSGWETAVSVRFYEIILRQTWDDGRLLFEAGQLVADRDFFASQTADVLLNGTFGFLGVGRAPGVAPLYPLAVPGVYLRARTEDARWEARVGVYTAAPGEDESSNFGFGWSFDNGAFFLGELVTRRRPFGLPGKYSLGVSGTTAELEDFDTGGGATGTYGLFASIDQFLVEETPNRPGLGVFVRSYGLPQAERNVLHWYVDFGLKLTRPFRGRAEDVLSLGFAHLRLSDAYVASQRNQGLDVSKQESILELAYRFQLTGWLSLQPDVQFFFDPHLSRRDATVIGLRAVIDL